MNDDYVKHNIPALLTDHCACKAAEDINYSECDNLWCHDLVCQATFYTQEMQYLKKKKCMYV